MASSTVCCNSLFHKDKVDGGNETEGSGCMIPMERLPLKYYVGDYCKDDERNALLNNFQLHQVERSPITDEANAIGWYLTTILEESYHPAKCYDAYQWPVTAHARLL